MITGTILAAAGFFFVAGGILLVLGFGINEGGQGQGSDDGQGTEQVFHFCFGRVEVTAEQTTGRWYCFKVINPADIAAGTKGCGGNYLHLADASDVCV